MKYAADAPGADPVKPKRRHRDHVPQLRHPHDAPQLHLDLAVAAPPPNRQQTKYRPRRGQPLLLAMAPPPTSAKASMLTY